ncbi:hypothetical protein [Rhodohalobacter sp.]|uniref:hypothetical protein n=1 Tax=Rhodohalobacter sp. TaxID=1974210 RepID=UPI002ACD2DB4|nr:hypothetical protein [Rhodohalobacter sp.]MDZ7757278.1 hypothetical protein [Rhodohalobacter sp.]
MARGRELKAEGHSTDEVREIREQEIKEGTLPMPEKPMSLYSLTGDADAWDYETGTDCNLRVRFMWFMFLMQPLNLPASPQLPPARERRG